MAATFQNLERAFQRRDEAALRQLWPSIPERELTKWRSNFKNARSIVYALRPKSAPTIDGSRASVDCRNVVRLEFPGDSQVYASDSTVQVLLTERDGNWIVQSIR